MMNKIIKKKTSHTKQKEGENTMAHVTSEIRASQWSVKAENIIKNSTIEELKNFILTNGEVEEDPDENSFVHVGKENLWGKTYMLNEEGFHHDEFFITDEGRIFFLISLNHQVEIIDEPEVQDTFSIWEGHMGDFEKKIRTVENKCRKYGCDFHYEKIGEEFKDVPTGDTDPLTNRPIMVKCRFIVVRCSGTAIINDWEFVASVEHTNKGNIFSKGLTTVEIPVRYRTAPCTCEHCKTNRIRKDTFIIRNTKTGEFKQVGKSCLQDFTNGMSASGMAWFASIKEIFKDVEERPVSGLTWYQKFYDTKEVLQFTAETIRHFGFRKSDGQGESTKDLMTRFFSFLHGDTKYWDRKYWSDTDDMIRKVGFNPDSQEAVRMTEDALNWISSQQPVNDYMHNLKTVCSLPEVHSGRFGLLVSLFPTWNRDLELQDKRRKEAESGKLSKHVGQVGDRIKVDVESVKCITSWESNFGYYPQTTYIWKITGKDGNIYTWKTTTWMNEEFPPASIKGTIKEHKVFRDVNQTELTRCKTA